MSSNLQVLSLCSCFHVRLCVHMRLGSQVLCLRMRIRLCLSVCISLCLSLGLLHLRLHQLLQPLRIPTDIYRELADLLQDTRVSVRAILSVLMQLRRQHSLDMPQNVGRNRRALTSVGLLPSLDLAVLMNDESDRQVLKLLY